MGTSPFKNEFSKRVADFSQAASRLVNDLHAENQRLQKELEEAKQNLAKQELQKNLKRYGKKALEESRFHVLFDGSGSMTTNNLLGKLIEEVAQSGQVIGQDLMAQGAVWGDNKPRWNNTLSHKELDSLWRGLSSGSDLSPMLKQAPFAIAQDVIDEKKSRFIILSDGDVFDKKEAVCQASKILKAFPDATIDFMIFGKHGTYMSDLANELGGLFPAQVSVTQIKENEIENSVMKVISSRLKKQKAPGLKKPQAPKP